MRTTRRIVAAAALLSVATLVGCEDLVVGGGDEVTGLTVQGAAGTLVTVDGSQVDGSLTLPVGASRSLSVTLRGPGGVVTPSISETVRVRVTNPGVASWEGGASGAGTLRGETVGTTSMRVDLLRAGSAVYTSPSIAVVVTP